MFVAEGFKETDDVFERSIEWQTSIGSIQQRCFVASYVEWDTCAGQLMAQNTLYFYFKYIEFAEGFFLDVWIKIFWLAAKDNGYVVPQDDGTLFSRITGKARTSRINGISRNTGAEWRSRSTRFILLIVFSQIIILWSNAIIPIFTFSLYVCWSTHGLEQVLCHVIFYYSYTMN